MSTRLELFKNRAKFYVYLDLHGPEGFFNSLLEYLAQLGAERVSDDFPLWSFQGQVDASDKYLEQLGTLFKSIPFKDVYPLPSEVMWRVLLMGPHSYHGFSGGCTASELEKLKREGRFKQ